MGRGGVERPSFRRASGIRFGAGEQRERNGERGNDQEKKIEGGFVRIRAEGEKKKTSQPVGGGGKSALGVAQ